MHKDLRCPNCEHKGENKDWVSISSTTSSGYSTLGCHNYSKEKETWLNLGIDLFGCIKCGTVIFKTK